MSLDPVIFAEFAKRFPLPDDGQHIRYTSKRGGGCGTVRLVWFAADTVAIKLDTGVQLFPEFGDTWEPA